MDNWDQIKPNKVKSPIQNYLAWLLFWRTAMNNWATRSSISYPPPSLQAQSQSPKQIEIGGCCKFTFAAALFRTLWCLSVSLNCWRNCKIFEFGYSKADRGRFPGLSVDNFLRFGVTKLFSWNNGFPTYFFAASSTVSLGWSPVLGTIAQFVYSACLWSWICGTQNHFWVIQMLPLPG